MWCPQAGQWRAGKTVLCSFGCVPWIVTDLRELSMTIQIGYSRGCHRLVDCTL
jgi:hypothetical protein